MIKTFTMKLDKIQPSQLFISSAKLSEVMKSFSSQSIDPIPVKKLGNHVVFVDGHTRALAAFLHDLSEVPVYWEVDKLDWDAYEICVGWCLKDGIHTVADLKDRIISRKVYEVLWLKRFERMQRDLEAKRKRTKR